MTERARPKGRARKWSPSKIEELAAADAFDLAPAVKAWLRGAPAMFRFLLHADPPHETEKRAPRA